MYIYIYIYMYTCTSQPKTCESAELRDGQPQSLTSRFRKHVLFVMCCCGECVCTHDEHCCCCSEVDACKEPAEMCDLFVFAITYF